MNRRLFLAGTAVGAGCLALPALASLPPAPFAFEVACGVARHLRWRLKGRYCRTWYTLDAVVPTHSRHVEVPRTVFGSSAERFGEVCDSIACVFDLFLATKPKYLLFLHTSKFDHGNVYEDVAVQSKQLGDQISVGITFRAFEDFYEPLPIREGAYMENR